ncbi:perlucin-like [Macrobrachium nipponense]|uniref:perlucin-like n=1 Tax=Macrobrachium nipponense TaxID=159736 RepID=UPI0030C86209
MLLLVLFLLVAQTATGVFGYSASAATWSYTTQTPKPSKCESPFVVLRARCVFVEPFLKSPWEESRYLCHELNSELVVVDDVQFYYDLLKFIRGEGIDHESYWIGANDTETEGKWVWVNGKAVESGSPFWAIGKEDYGSYYLEPAGQTSQNCLILEAERAHYFNDRDCIEEHATICEKHFQ